MEGVSGGWCSRSEEASAEAQASAVARRRAGVMGGSWVFGLDVELRGEPASRFTYCVALRLRCGLIAPALPAAPEESCSHVSAAGVRCSAALDECGHHLEACGTGGGFVRRHNGIVWAGLGG